MFRRLVVALCAIMAAGALISADAHRLPSRGSGENLVVIAEHDIDLATDRYSIDISKAKGGYKALRIKAKQGFFDISSVQVIYADGSKHDEVRQIDMYQGERSRQINPTGDHRFIDQVNIAQVPGRGRGGRGAPGAGGQEREAHDGVHALHQERPDQEADPRASQLGAGPPALVAG
mgnify:CR=1 FL=1